MADEVKDAPQSGGDESGRSVESSAPAELTRPQLETKVTDSLKALSTADDTPEILETPITADDATEVKSAETEPQEIVPLDQGGEVGEDDATEPKSEEEGKTEDQQPKPKAKVPTVPDALRRSLRAYDWTDEDIDAAAKENPLGFLTLAQKVHATRNSELARWADIGRAAREGVQPDTSKTATEQSNVPQHVDPKTGLFRQINTDAMVQKYGNEELVNEIVSPVNQIIAQINAVLPDLMSGVNSIKQTRQQTLATQIDGFFGGKDLSPYAEVYGKDSKSMTPEQIQARNKVLEMGDALIAGAAQQGRSLSVNEALLLAHDSVSGGFNKQAIRQDLKKQVVQRNKGITLRPTQGGSDKSGPPSTGKEMENRTRQRLAKVFG